MAVRLEVPVAPSTAIPAVVEGDASLDCVTPANERCVEEDPGASTYPNPAPAKAFEFAERSVMPWFGAQVTLTAPVAGCGN